MEVKTYRCQIPVPNLGGAVQDNPGASLHVYTPGTTTPVVIYLADCTTPQSNPVIADANGNATLAAPNGAYDIQIVSTDGTLSVTIPKVLFADTADDVTYSSVTITGGDADSADEVPTLEQIQKRIGALIYQGTWNASTNTPTLVSATGNKGWSYRVSATGTTTLDGISAWNVGDRVWFDGAAWQRDAVSHTVAAGTDIAVANGDGSAGNPTISLPTVLTAAHQIADGSAGAPGLAVHASNHGLFWDGVNTGIGVAIGGSQIGYFNAAGWVVSIPGGGISAITLQGEGVTTSGVTNCRASTLAGSFTGKKARGTIALPTAVLINDVLLDVFAQGYGATAYQNSAAIRFSCIETSISDTAMGGQVQLRACAIGAVSLTTIALFDVANGIQMFGANPVIDANRVFRPRSYATASVPAVTATGLIHVSDESGRNTLAYADGTAFRRIGDGQVVSATVDYRGIWGNLSQRYSSTKLELIRQTYEKLAAAGLLSKLLGLWVHALDTQTDALLNWITPGTRNMAIVGSPTFTAGQGFTGDGSSALLSTGATYAAFGASQNSAAVGCYVLTASGSAKAVIGQNSLASTRASYLQSNTSGALVARIMDISNDNYTPSKYTGLFVLDRASSANYQASVDDGAQTTVTRASTSSTAVIPAFLGTTDTTGTEYSTAQIAFSFVSTSLTANDIAHLRAIMVDYLLAGLGTVNNTVANLPPAADFQNTSIYVSDLGGGAGTLRSNGVNWLREAGDGEETIATDANFTLTPLTNGRFQKHTGTLTADRTITLSTTDAKGTTVAKGERFRVTRTGSGAFNLSVGGLKNLATNSAAEAVFDGTAWYLASYGTL